jgi:hypothetical protein
MRILFRKQQCQLKCSIFPWRIIRTAPKQSASPSVAGEELEVAYPKITAFHNIMLSSQGAALIPDGGVSFNFLRSRIRRLRALVDMTHHVFVLRGYENTPHTF